MTCGCSKANEWSKYGCHHTRGQVETARRAAAKLKTMYARGECPRRAEIDALIDELTPTTHKEQI